MSDPQSLSLFATVSDIEARWRPLTDSERVTAEALLIDVSDLIRSECPRWADATHTALTRVACQAVIRAMRPPLGIDGAQGAASVSTNAGPYSQSVSFSANSADLYVTKAEARSLGGRRVGAFEFNLLARKGA